MTNRQDRECIYIVKQRQARYIIIFLSLLVVCLVENIFLFQ